MATDDAWWATSGARMIILTEEEHADALAGTLTQIRRVFGDEAHIARFLEGRGHLWTIDVDGLAMRHGECALAIVGMRVEPGEVPAYVIDVDPK